MIYQGTNEINNIYQGNEEIQAVYVGNDEVWTNQSVIDLGTAQTFNVGSILSGKGITNIDTTQLTVNNFFFGTINSSSRTHRVGWVSGNHADYGDIWINLEKSYNSSTSVLTFRGATHFGTYFDNWGVQYNSLHAYLVVKPSKLISLGSAQSYNCTDISGYQNLTADNFIFSTASQAYSRTGTEPAGEQGQHTAYYSFQKSYAGGMLSAYLQANSDGYVSKGNSTAFCYKGRYK